MARLFLHHVRCHPLMVSFGREGSDKTTNASPLYMGSSFGKVGILQGSGTDGMANADLPSTETGLPGDDTKKKPTVGQQGRYRRRIQLPPYRRRLLQ